MASTPAQWVQVEWALAQWVQVEWDAVALVEADKAQAERAEEILVVAGLAVVAADEVVDEAAISPSVFAFRAERGSLIKSQRPTALFDISQRLQKRVGSIQRLFALR